MRMFKRHLTRITQCHDRQNQTYDTENSSDSTLSNPMREYPSEKTTVKGAGRNVEPEILATASPILSLTALSSPTHRPYLPNSTANGAAIAHAINMKTACPTINFLVLLLLDQEPLLLLCWTGTFALTVANCTVMRPKSSCTCVIDADADEPGLVMNPALYDHIIGIEVIVDVVGTDQTDVNVVPATKEDEELNVDSGFLEIDGGK
jgi:hypothetical protein